MINVMLLKQLKKTEIATINPNEWYVFDKFDGFRAIWDKGKFYGRNNENWQFYFPEVVNALQPYLNCVFDGELTDRATTPKPSTLQRRLTSNLFHIKVMSGTYNPNIKAELPATLMVFDILEKDGKDLKSLSFEERQKILQDTLKENEWLQMVKPIEKSPIEAFNEVTGKGFEGIVLKRKGSKYQEGERGDFWLKVKAQEEEVLKFTAYEENPAGITLTDGTHRVACAGKQSHFVKQEIDTIGYAFCEIRFLEKTENGMYRQPTFSRLVKVM